MNSEKISLSPPLLLQVAISICKRSLLLVLNASVCFCWHRATNVPLQKTPFLVTNSHLPEICHEPVKTPMLGNIFPNKRQKIISPQKGWILSCLRNFWGTFEGPIYLEGRVITALIWTVGQPHPKTKHLRDILVSMSKLTHPRFSHSEYFQPLSIELLRTTLFQQEEKSS